MINNNHNTSNVKAQDHSQAINHSQQNKRVSFTKADEVFLFDEHHNTDVQNEKERILKLKAEEKEKRKQNSQDESQKVATPPKSAAKGRGRPRKQI